MHHGSISVLIQTTELGIPTMKMDKTKMFEVCKDNSERERLILGHPYFESEE